MKNIQLYTLLLLPTVLHAAQPIDLAKIPSKEFSKMRLMAEKNIKETSRHYDFNQTLHVRFQQRFNGYRIWGADGVLHYPKQAKMAANANGKMYKYLDQDITEPPQYILTSQYQQKVEQEVIKTYQTEKGRQSIIQEKQSEMLVFVDEKNKAHWAFLVKLFVKPGPHLTPEMPAYIIDAITLQVYRQWNEIKTEKLDEVYASGYGGNPIAGKFVYDGLKDHLSALLISRHSETNTCYLKNKDFHIRDHANSYETIQFRCTDKDKDHNNTYWHEELTFNGGYSRSNDVLYNAMLVNNMYHEWYQLEIGGEYSKPLSLSINEDMENAYFDNRHQEFSFGNGGKIFYPLTSLDVVAHELSHSVTHFNSNLEDFGQAAAINESFSDMAAKAASYYAKLPVVWDIGSDVKKDKAPIRYMIKPSQDCNGRPPGWFCSIDRASQYGLGIFIDEHHGAGVFNRFFHILATSPDWDVKKAFDVVVQANRYYWTSQETFQTAACGVWRAAQDLAKKDPSYKIQEVRWSFREVDIETDDCV